MSAQQPSEPNGPQAAAQHMQSQLSPTGIGFNASGGSTIAPQPVPTTLGTAPNIPTSVVSAAAAFPAPPNTSLVPGTDGTSTAQHANYWNTAQGVAHRYRAFEANRADALLASIGLLNAGLMDIASALQAAIGTSLASSKSPVKRLQKLLPLIDAELRVVRQVERLSMLERKLPRRTDF
jgi:hypothetical protein